VNTIIASSRKWRVAFAIGAIAFWIAAFAGLRLFAAVGAVIDMRITGSLFGRHVCGRADRRADLGQRWRREVACAVALGTIAAARDRDRLRDPEIRNDRGSPAEQHVVRLDVAVHDATLVRVLERLGDVTSDADDFRDGEALARNEVRAEGLALDERHGVERQPAGLTDREHRDDVRLLERGRHLDLALEPVRGNTDGELWRQDLHDHLAAQPRLLGCKHPRHSAASELALEGVGRAKCRLQLRAQIHADLGGLRGRCAAPLT